MPPLTLQSDIADPKPSSGIGLIVVGWVASGIGALNLATLPICFADFYPEESKGLCIGLSAAFAGVGFAVGLPALIIGYNQRSDYKAWKKRHALVGLLMDTSLALDRDGARLSLRGEL